MARTPPRNKLDAPLSDAELAVFAGLLEDVSERTEQGLSLEHLDGFITALICSPRLIMPSEYLPVLLGNAGMAVFTTPDEAGQFMAFLQRRWNQVVQALNAPIDSLADPGALEPLIMDWEGLLEELPPDERASLLADGFPEFASVWAAGFLQVLDVWEADWALPADSKDEAFVDEMLDSFFVLITPQEDLTPDERSTRREDHVAMAIWSAYELRDFWLDRGYAPSMPLRKAAEPDRNVLCPCGSGKKYKQCCGTVEKLH